MDRASRRQSKTSMATAEEALKNYRERMSTLERKLKMDMELQTMKRQGLAASNDHDSDDDLPQTSLKLGPSASTLEGREMLKNMFDERLKINQETRENGVTLDTEHVGKDFKVRAEDLIMMTVPEKLSYMSKRQ